MSEDKESDQKQEPKTTEEIARRLTYTFLNLRYLTRLRLALEFQLIRNDDEGLSAGDAWRTWLGRLSRDKTPEFYLQVEYLYQVKVIHGKMENSLFRHPNCGPEFEHELSGFKNQLAELREKFPEAAERTKGK